MKRAVRLSREEKRIEKTLDSGEWKSASKSEVGRHAGMAGSFLDSAKKEGRINIRIARRDIALIKEMAEAEGLPYQTLMASVLHKYATGLLVDRKAISEIKRIIGSKNRAGV